MTVVCGPVLDALAHLLAPAVLLAPVMSLDLFWNEVLARRWSSNSDLGYERRSSQRNAARGDRLPPAFVPCSMNRDKHMDRKRDLDMPGVRRKSTNTKRKRVRMRATTHSFETPTESPLVVVNAAPSAETTSRFPEPSRPSPQPVVHNNVYVDNIERPSEHGGRHCGHNAYWPERNAGWMQPPPPYGPSWGGYYGGLPPWAMFGGPAYGYPTCGVRGWCGQPVLPCTPACVPATPSCPVPC